MEPLGSARGALRAPRSTGWEPLLYGKGKYCCRHVGLFPLREARREGILNLEEKKERH